MTAPTPQEIARRLTKAQRKALMWLGRPHHRGTWLPMCAAPDAVTHIQLVGTDDLGQRRIKVARDDWDALRGLIRASSRRGQLFDLSPLGLLVRAELERMEAPHE